MKHQEASRKIKVGQAHNLTIRLRMGVMMKMVGAVITRGPQYVKKDGAYTIRVKIPGQKRTSKVLVHQITDIS